MSRKTRPVKVGEGASPRYPNFREYTSLKNHIRRAVTVGALAIGLSACGGPAVGTGDGDAANPPHSGKIAWGGGTDAGGTAYVPPDTGTQAWGGGLDPGEGPPYDSGDRGSTVVPGDGASDGEADAATDAPDATDGNAYVPPEWGGELGGLPDVGEYLPDRDGGSTLVPGDGASESEADVAADAADGNGYSPPDTQGFVDSGGLTDLGGGGDSPVNPGDGSCENEADVYTPPEIPATEGVGSDH